METFTSIHSSDADPDALQRMLADCADHEHTTSAGQSI
jgi:hypothetical protein